MKQITLLKPREKKFDGCLMIYLQCDNWSQILSKIDNSMLYLDPENLNEYGIENNPHVTVLYGLDQDTSRNDIINFVSKIDVNKIDINPEKQVSYFENDKFNVAKIAVHSEYLNKMHSEIKDKMLVQLSNNKYSPHITLAYLSKGQTPSIVFDNLDFKVSTIKYSCKSNEIKLIFDKDLNLIEW